MFVKCHPSALELDTRHPERKPVEPFIDIARRAVANGMGDVLCVWPDDTVKMIGSRHATFADVVAGRVAA